MTRRLWILPPATAGLFFGLALPVLAAEAVDQLEALERAAALTREKKWPEAAAAWQKVVDANPYRGRAWVHLARARYETKEYDRCIAANEKALELREGFPWMVAYDIACCHAVLGDKEQALRWLEKSFAMGFRDLAMARAEGDLKSLHDEPRFRDLVALVDVGKMTRTEGWHYDIGLLVRELKRLHYVLSKRPAPEGFDALARQLHDDVPRLTDRQLEVGLMKLARLAGDAHTKVSPSYALPGNRRSIPVRFYLFEEGLFITSASAVYKDLAGARVLRFGAHSVDDVCSALDPVISRDHRMWPKFMGPRLMPYPQLLNGLGVIPEDDRVTLTVRGADGKERAVTLVAAPGEPGDDWVSARDQTPGPEPLYLRNRKANYWFEYLSDSRSVYCQYNEAFDDPKEPMERFCERLFGFIARHDVRALVIDMRHNGGGDMGRNRPLLDGLIRCDKVNRRGKLFVIVGLNTFSAAQCGAAQIERYTQAIFVGEPTGSPPNFVGESNLLQLPYSKMVASISDLYWQNALAIDYRTWIAPHVYVPPTFAAYRDKRDPALAAVLAHGARSR
jgi:tetratricopeptide (TPR) repeat protein